MRVAVAALAGLCLACPGCPEESPGGTGALTVTVLGTTATPLPGVSVGIASLSQAALTGGSGKAHFASLPTGVVSVVVNFVGYCTATVSATIVSSVDTPLTVSVCSTSGSAIVGGGASSGGAGSGGGGSAPVVDVVTVATAATDPAVAFVNGVGEPISAPACVVGRLRTGLGTVPLDVNLLPPATAPASGAPCLSTLITWSPFRALFFADDPTVLAWTTESDNLAVSPPARVRVPAAVWITDVGDAYAGLDSQIVTLHLPRAQQALDASGAGLLLAAGESDPALPPVKRVTTLPNSAVLLVAIGSGCANIDQIRAQPSIYSPTRLNIYYVASVDSPWSSGAPSGYVCVVEGAPDIIFMSASSGTPLTFAHETAHALGVTEPNFGHVTWELGGFPVNADPKHTSRNIMSYSVQEPVGFPPVGFSRGQAARMALTPGAFVNRMVGGSSLRSRAFGSAAAPLVNCPCSTAEPSGRCPILSLTEESGLMSSSAPFLLACRVEPSVPSLSLCAPGGSGPTSQTIEITLKSADAMGTLVDAIANYRLWWAVDPSVATVSEVPHSSGGNWSILSAKVTALKTGTTNIIVDAGGPSARATVPVTVTGC